MSIRIIKKGSLDAIQDLGRFGYQHLGIPPGGALDPWALQLANGLVGNTPGEAGLELFFRHLPFSSKKMQLLLSAEQIGIRACREFR